MTNKEYKKYNSFNEIQFKKKINKEDLILKIQSNLNYENNNDLSDYQKSILERVKKDLFKQKTKEKFVLSNHVFNEINQINEKDILKYLFHRYRYEVFPKNFEKDDYPPFLQIEPSSICNYRCVFCFETDETFTNKKNGHMGVMPLELFKEIIDQAENNIQFISIASRGEPFVNKEIPKMLEYTRGKFLSLKINTNASLLDEKKIHAILSGGVTTIVFSADAADPELYAKLRVNGKLEKVLKNIEMFNKIKEKKYKGSKIISRVSGVKVGENQKIEDMHNLWGQLVDQVAFVNYNPWENVYDKEESKIKLPCSDLWRRMFVWWDGKINPCDTDYKSILSASNFKDTSLRDAWNSQKYNDYRDKHINNNRSKIYPCKNCVLV
tara:strand:+ start:823 stop:1965 length:1143 start_codon:yes stop_codon:yes gene_type:complete